MKPDSKDGESFSECEPFATRSGEGARSWLICNRLAVLLLLLGLAGLGAQAKDRRYCHRMGPERESSLATKINVLPPDVNFSTPRLLRVGRIVVAQPRQKPQPWIEAEPPISESIGVTVAMQHRSPPESLQS